MRKIIKQFVPYGIMCIWLIDQYGIKVDESLFRYAGRAKRIKRLIKFSLPYGLVQWYKRRKYEFPMFEQQVNTVVSRRCRNRNVFYVASSVANQDELNTRMAVEVEKRGIPYAN